MEKVRLRNTIYSIISYIFLTLGVFSLGFLSLFIKDLSLVLKIIIYIILIIMIFVPYELKAIYNKKTNFKVYYIGIIYQIFFIILMMIFMYVKVLPMIQDHIVVVKNEKSYNITVKDTIKTRTCN